MLKSFLHYQVDKKLGEGGMGVVYHAHDTKLKRSVALKFLPGHISKHSEERRRFQHEAQSAAALNHPHIAQVYAIEESDGELVIVMEYIEGQELKEAIEAKKLSVSQKYDIAKQIALGLKAAHDKGVIHRDIKSRNIMLDREDRVKIMDFGLAHIQGAAHRTKTGTTVGTTAYMAPEQLVGDKVDKRSDIWSFGVVLYELFTGELPFKGAYEPAVIYAITEEEPVPSSELNPDIPGQIGRVIKQCLVKDKTQRYQNMDAILADLTEQDSPVDAIYRSKKTTSFLAKVGIPVVVLMVLTSAFYLFKPVFLEQNSNIPAKRYLAVLPIENIGNNPAMQAICEGLAETFSFKLSELERYEDSYWVAPASEMREEKIKSATQANKLFGVNLVILSSIQTIEDSTHLILELVDADQVRRLETQRVVVSSQNLSLLEREGVQAMMNMLEIKSSPSIDKALTEGGSSNSDAYEYYLKGRANLQDYLVSDSLENAITFFQKAIDTDPKFTLAYAGLGESYWRKYESEGDANLVEKADSSLQKALELNRELAPVQTLVGLVSQGTGDYDSAIKHFRKALEIDPNYTPAYRGLATVYDEKGDDEKAVATYKYAIAMKPQIWEGYNDLGKHYFSKGNFDAASGQFQKVIQLTPQNSTAYSNLGVCYYYQGKYDNAKEAFQMSLALEKNPFAASNLASIYFVDGMYKQSARLYEIALETYDSRYDLWGNLAVAYEFSGDQKKARKTYTTAIEKAKDQLQVNPNDAEVMADIGAYYSDIADTQNARNYIRKALALNNESIPVRLRAVSTYEKLGTRQEALQWINASMISDIESQPELKELVKDPRYLAIKAKLDLDPQK